MNKSTLRWIWLLNSSEFEWHSVNVSLKSAPLVIHGCNGCFLIWIWCSLFPDYNWFYRIVSWKNGIIRISKKVATDSSSFLGPALFQPFEPSKRYVPIFLQHTLAALIHHLSQWQTIIIIINNESEHWWIAESKIIHAPHQDTKDKYLINVMVAYVLSLFLLSILRMSLCIYIIRHQSMIGGHFWPCSARTSQA